jgi:hypothetical protein
MTWNVSVWRVGEGSEPHGSGAALRRGLGDGRISIVVLKGLVPVADFDRNSARIRRLFDRAMTTTYSNGQLTTIGPYLAKYSGDRHAYFESAAQAATLVSEAEIDLAELTRRRLADVLSLRSFDVAVEPDGARYASHNVRIYSDDIETPLHNDNIVRDMTGSDLVLATLSSHFSCVVCVQECDLGGQLELYRKAWEPVDEEHKIVGGLGYDIAVVEGVEC